MKIWSNNNVAVGVKFCKTEYLNNSEPLWYIEYMITEISKGYVTIEYTVDGENRIDRTRIKVAKQLFDEKYWTRLK